jgi:hypothetical protein
MQQFGNVEIFLRYSFTIQDGRHLSLSKEALNERINLGVGWLRWLRWFFGFARHDLLSAYSAFIVHCLSRAHIFVSRPRKYRT